MDQQNLKSNKCLKDSESSGWTESSSRYFQFIFCMQIKQTLIL